MSISLIWTPCCMYIIFQFENVSVILSHYTFWHITKLPPWSPLYPSSVVVHSSRSVNAKKCGSGRLITATWHQDCSCSCTAGRETAESCFQQQSCFQCVHETNSECGCVCAQQVGNSYFQCLLTRTGQVVKEQPRDQQNIPPLSDFFVCLASSR